MISVISKKKVIVVGVVVLILLILIFLIRNSTNQNPENPIKPPATATPVSQPSNPPTITPTIEVPSPTTGAPTGSVVDPRSPHFYIDQETENKNNAIANLLTIVPHRGNYFAFEYDIEANIYTAIISAANKDEGNREFDSFLKDNGILERSWISGLVVEYR